MSQIAQSVREQVSPEEWRVRVQLAALYRLAAIHRWDDFLFTHISARVPGADNQFLLNPVGFWFEEITASSLVKVDQAGETLLGEHPINKAGFVIHSAIHAARDDAHFIVHFHSDDGVALASHNEGLLPLNQRALSVGARLAYHDYEGIAEDLSERERLVASLGDKSSLVLRNHGTLALGPTAAQAWLAIYSLERAATAQVRALSAGRDGVLLAPAGAVETVKDQVRRRPIPVDVDRVWAAIQRKVDRESPGYDV